ncbi:MAG: class I SAM-dependent methyltransferase [Alphaproteobacteria bacterium]|nr:MAG: class I SAM-dependent methyltransferase [Alphaproteobacteria bacterium]
MIRQPVRSIFLALAIAAGTAGIAASQAPSGDGHEDALKTAIAAPSRTATNVARDRYRHPYETLRFFGVRPSDTVVEIWPGGGWYTEILAPYLRSGGGTYYAAALPGQQEGIGRIRARDSALYGAIRPAVFPAFDSAAARVPDGSADVVLTFRNVHNWRMGYQREDRQDYSGEAFRQIFAMLRPGGTLGVVDHRLPENADAERERSSGYIKVSTIRRLAEAAGFRFVAASEVNANPRDTADWPNGVWTLPPALRLGDVDRERYLAIGESDRMTLRFVKPE